MAHLISIKNIRENDYLFGFQPLPGCNEILEGDKSGRKLELSSSERAVYLYDNKEKTKIADIPEGINTFIIVAENRADFGGIFNIDGCGLVKQVSYFNGYMLTISRLNELEKQFTEALKSVLAVVEKIDAKIQKKATKNY